MFAYCVNNPISYRDILGARPVLLPHIVNGLNLPPSGGVPVNINGTIYYYAIDVQNGELYEYWFDSEGNIVWGRHHSDHKKPWRHENPHDHQGGKDKDDENTLVGGPKPVDKKFHGPDEFSSRKDEQLKYAGVAAGVTIAGIAIYQAVKWTAATMLAPATGGTSYVVVALMP